MLIYKLCKLKIRQNDIIINLLNLNNNYLFLLIYSCNKITDEGAKYISEGLSNLV